MTVAERSPVYLPPMFRVNRLSKLVLVLILGLSIFSSVRWRLVGDDGNAWRTIIFSDGAGYYAYLPNLYFNHKLSPPQAEPGHLSATPGGPVLKYTAGTALLESPFFMLASAKGLFDQKPEDGRSLHYAIALALCSIAYLLFGLECLRRLLLNLGIDDSATAITLAVAALGTGLGYYAWMEPCMSHVYSFAMVSTILYAARLAWITGKAKYLFATGLFLGLVVLVRPVDIIAIIALPLATLGHPQPFTAWLKRMGTANVLLAVLIAALVIAVQPLLWYMQCGLWWVRPYTGEGFNWTSPVVLRSLFGAQKGLFVYWPLLLLIIPGLWALARRSLRLAANATVFFALLVYITSAWWCWTYAGGYGQRPYLNHLAVAAVPIGLFFQDILGPKRRIVFTMVLPFIALQCFQAWQHTVGILHAENMDREKWPYIFLKSDAKWRGALGGAYEARPFAPCGMIVVAEAGAGEKQGSVAKPDLLSRFPSDTAEVVSLDANHPTGPFIELPAGELPTGKGFLLEGSVDRLELWPGSSNDVKIFWSIVAGDTLKDSWAFKMNDIPEVPGWRHWRHQLLVPALKPGQSLRYYYALQGDGACELRAPRFKLNAVEPCPD